MAEIRERQYVSSVYPLLDQLRSMPLDLFLDIDSGLDLDLSTPDHHSAGFK